MWVAYLILALYALSMIGIAIYTRNRSKSVDDFLHGGKKGLNGWMTAFAYGTTYFSAVIFIGYAGNFGRQFGLSAVWIGIGNAILGALVAWLVLAKRTKAMTTRLQAKTMPDFFEKRYGSSKLKIISAIVIFLFLIPYSASVYNGLSSLFEVVFEIPKGYVWIVMVVLALITAIYLFFGGYFATALSDFIQGIIMLIGIVLLVSCFMNYETINWDISSIADTWLPKDNGNLPWVYNNTCSLISLVCLTSFGVWALPQTVHKYYAVRDDKAIKQGMIVSTVFALIIGFGAYFIGSLSGLIPGINAVGAKGFKIGGDYVIPEMMVKIAVPAWLIGIFSVLILSASMSTLSSVSLSSSSVIAVDLYKGALNKNASDKKVTWTMRILCVAFIIISVVIAILNQKYNISAIAHLMGLSWGTLAGCFIGPFVLGLIWKKVSTPAVWASIISALVLTCGLTVLLGALHPDFNGGVGEILKLGVKCSPFIGVVCMIFSFAITAIVTAFTKSPSQEIIDKAFNQAVANND